MQNVIKRKTGPTLTQTLLDFDLGESSSDSDFRIEDHDDESDDCSLGSRDDNDGDDDDADDDDDDDDGDDDDDDGDDNDDDDDEDDEDDDDNDEDVAEAEENEGDDEEEGDQNTQQVNGTAGGKRRKKNESVHGADDSGEEEDEESATDGGRSEPKAKAATAAAAASAATDYQANQSAGTTKPSSSKATAINEKDAAVQKLLLKSICCACLGDRSDDQNEIVECDGCGVTVHEGCYGVSECTSISSTTSSCSTEPWFCDACKAGVENPDCELCPNRGGIFKETDVGKWVHLVCALYVPGVAFGEVDQLSSVTLFEMPYNKWGAKTCSLCEDAKLARTGVCIGCDAGMCKTYFHVTCAQYHGLLSEAHSEEADQADPFYAHCKIHSDKSLIKHRKRNYNAIKMKALQRQMEEEVASRSNQTQSAGQARIERKLTKHRKRYVFNKETKNPPWVPTQKMPRLLITSATACKKLLLKAELMGLDMAAIEFQEAQMAALVDVRKKWHIPPAFNVEFIGYYLDRTIRLGDMKKNLQAQMQANKQLLGQQQQLRVKYDRSVVQNQEALKRTEASRERIASLYAHLLALAPNKVLVPIEQIGKPAQPAPQLLPLSPPPPPPPPSIAAPYGKVASHASVVINTASTSSGAPHCATPPARTMTVPTAAALKMGVGFPLQNLLVPGGGKRDDTGRILSTQCKQNSEDLLNECGICKRCHDQHLLAKCDTCHLHYHLGCLNPPLTRHPKKSKLYGWQCSECDRSDDSNPESIIIPKMPRKSRTRYSKDGTIVPYHMSFGADQQQPDAATGRDFLQHNARKAGRAASSASGSREASTTAPTTAGSVPVTPSAEAPRAPPLDGNGSPSRRPLSSSPTAVKQEEMADSPPSKVDSTNNLSAADPQSGTDSSSLTLLSPTKTPGKRGRKRKVVPQDSPTSPTAVPQGPQSAAEDSATHGTHSAHKREPGVEDEATAAAAAGEAQERVQMADRHEAHQSSMVVHGQVESTTTTAQTPPVNQQHGELPSSKSNGEANAACAAAAISSEATAAAATSTHHKHSKRRKEKHRNRSPNAIAGKDHKRKRKRRNHDYDLYHLPGDCGGDYAKPSFDGDNRPRIKIKIKSVLDGSNTHTTQIFYVRDETEPEKSLNTLQLISGAADSSSHQVEPSGSVVAPSVFTYELGNVDSSATSLASPEGTSQKGMVPHHARGRTKRESVSSRAGGAAQSTGAGAGHESVCDVCQFPGTPVNSVQCDECHKNYHFGCLDPPLKKTPKRRGYSWHCADCDPTDVEN